MQVPWEPKGGIFYDIGIWIKQKVVTMFLDIYNLPTKNFHK